MEDTDIHDHQAIQKRLRRQAEAGRFRVTLHAHQEMIDEDISIDEVREVLLDATVVENYPEHERGSCCLVCGWISRKRYIHVVCTTSLDLVIIITVYEPMLPKWITPFERGKKDEM
ncbi:MAG: DUF4258 domain-containing protein [Candidatus Omnitrophota bacterium]|jgi:hypothetical protein|nr:MAG: DUF4258 domain-containing protein [Candidatus Omnitrophota bacterium]